VNVKQRLDALTPSQFIQERRVVLGISQAEVGRQLELRGILVSHALISMWFTGRRLPRGPKLDILCQVLAIYGDVRTELLARIAVMQGMVEGGEQ